MKIKKETAIKILVAMLTIFMLATCMQSTVFATDYLNPDNVVAQQSEVADKTQSIGNQVLGIVQVVAIAVAVIMLVVLAIKYLTSSPNEKADVKKSMWTYLIGAIVLFGASGILQIIKNFVVDATKSK